MMLASTPPVQPSLASAALRGGVVTGAAQGLKLLISFASVVILARLLSPEDFGLLAATAPVVAFVGLLQSLGLQQAIVQRAELHGALLDQSFWLSLLSGLLAAVVVLASAPAVAAFYGDPRMVGILRWTSLALLFGVLGTVPSGLLARDLRFGVLAFADVASAAIGLVVAAALAWRGWGYWSLVAAPIATAATVLAIMWNSARWWPRRFKGPLDHDLIVFGANLTGFNFVNFLSRNADNVLIGRFVGLDALGLYDRAYKLLLFPLQNVAWPLSRVMVPILSRVQAEPGRLRAIFVRVMWLLGAMMMPGIAAVTMTAAEVVDVLFGPRWAGVAPIFAWLGAAGFAQVILSNIGWVFMARGRTGLMFKLGLFGSAVTVAAFVVGLRGGAVGVAAAYAISGYLIRVPVQLAVVHRMGPVRWSDLAAILGTLGAAAVASALVVTALRPEFASLPSIVIVTVSVAVNYAAAALALLSVPASRAALGPPLAAAIAWVGKRATQLTGLPRPR